MKQIIRRVAALVVGLGLGAVALAGLETVTHISDLNASWPLGSDLASTSDDHIRNIKSALKTDFPNFNGTYNSATAPVFAIPNDTNTGMYGPSADNLAFATGGSQRVLIGPSGNVTVNAPASGSPVTINGTTGGGGFVTGTVSVNSAITVDLTNSNTGSSANNYLRFANSTDTLALGLSSTSASFAAFFTNGPTGEQSFFGPSAGIPLSIGTNGIERLRVAGAGNVTINAPTSGSALTVTGLASSGIYAETINGANSAGSRGLNVKGGTSSSDFAIVVNDAANAKNLLLLAGDGTLSVYGPVAATSVDLTPDTGTFTSTYTGFTAGITCTSTWSRIGKIVLLALCAGNGTSNATSFTMTGLPSAIQPATITQNVPLDATVVKNSGNFINTPTGGSAAASVTVTAASGTLTFNQITNANGWTNTGAKGIFSQTTIMYLLN